MIRKLLLAFLLAVTTPSGAYEIIDGSSPSTDASSLLGSLATLSLFRDGTMQFRRLRDGNTKVGVICGERRSKQKGGDFEPWTIFAYNPTAPFYLDQTDPNPDPNAERHEVINWVVPDEYGHDFAAKVFAELGCTSTPIS